MLVATLGLVLGGLALGRGGMVQGLVQGGLALGLVKGGLALGLKG